MNSPHLDFFVSNIMQKKFDRIGRQLLRIIVGNVVLIRGRVQYDEMRRHQVAHDNRVGDLRRSDPPELEVRMERLIVLSNYRFHHVAKLQFEADNFIQFIFFNDGQHKELFRLADLMDIGSCDLRKSGESFFVHPTMECVIQEGFIHYLEIAGHWRIKK